MNIYRRVCLPCMDAAFNKVKGTCDVENLWRMHAELQGVKDICPVGLYPAECPHFFEQAIAKGMEKDDGTDRS